MRTFTFGDAKSYKFWNIELAGNEFTVTYGRIGTNGQTQVKTFANAAAARKAHDKLIAEKTGKGYTETTKGGAPSPAGGAGLPSSTTSVLERALGENPDDLATLQAYADELAERGDPRGEFIQTQLALEEPRRSPAERKKLQAREQQLLKKHKADWLGPELAALIPDRRTLLEMTFARGWLSRVKVHALSVAQARALIKAPAGRFLRELVITSSAFEEDGDFEPGDDVPEGTEGRPSLYPLLRAPFLGTLRKFTLGEDNEMYCGVSGVLAADLVERMSRIEELHLYAHHVDAAKLFRLKNLGQLRSLSLYHCHDYPLSALAKNPALGKLETINFHPHALEPGDDEEGYLSVAGIKALTSSKTLSSLQHVSLKLTGFGDEGLKWIVKSGVLKRWKTLDLSKGNVTDAGAAMLAASPDLQHLEWLNLSKNGLTSAGKKVLKATGVKFEAESQHDVDDEEYLTEGDWE